MMSHGYSKGGLHKRPATTYKAVSALMAQQIKLSVA